MAIVIDSLRGVSISTLSTKDLIGIFLSLNIVAYVVLLIIRKWSALNKTSRSTSPDLEKPLKPGAKEKVTRKLGGKALVLTFFNIHISGHDTDLVYRMDTICFQETDCHPISRLERPHIKTNSLQTIPIWPVRLPSRSNTLYRI